MKAILREKANNLCFAIIQQRIFRKISLSIESPKTLIKIELLEKYD